MQSFQRLAIAIALLFTAGCASQAERNQTDVEVVFPTGAFRTELHSRTSPGKFVRLGPGEPEDRFAAATIYQMVAMGKPRPRAYEIFLTPALDGKETFWDYVFYNDQERVTYVARRRSS